MSFEGYYQSLCSEGHSWTFDVYDAFDPTEGGMLPCGHQAVWWNMVDQTNGCEDHQPDGTCQCGAVMLECRTLGKDRYTCEKCGHHEPGEDITYEIPVGMGHDLRPASPGNPQ